MKKQDIYKSSDFFGNLMPDHLFTDLSNKMELDGLIKTVCVGDLGKWQRLTKEGMIDSGMKGRFVDYL